jgi:phospholipid/cholesterol/gamma-HCH transport system substrate-binding protein
LYDTALETIENFRDQSLKIEPLMNDLRLFTDAIARDPGQLGIRGAVRNRNAPKTGYKGSTLGRESTAH